MNTPKDFERILTETKSLSKKYQEWPLKKLIEEADAGEQNRYGDIEFKNSTEVRRVLLLLASEHFMTSQKPEEVEGRFAEALYWAFNSDSVLIKLLYSRYKVSAVKRGFHVAFEDRLTQDSQGRWVETHVREMQSLQAANKEFVEFLISKTNSLKELSPETRQELLDSLMPLKSFKEPAPLPKWLDRH